MKFVAFLLTTTFSFALCTTSGIIDDWLASYQHDRSLITSNAPIESLQIHSPWIVAEVPLFSTKPADISKVQELFYSHLHVMKESLNAQLFVFSSHPEYHNLIYPLIEYCKIPSSFYMGLEVKERVELQLDRKVDGCTPFEWALKKSADYSILQLLLTERVVFESFKERMNQVLLYCIEHDVRLLESVVKRIDFQGVDLVGFYGNREMSDVLLKLMDYVLIYKPEMKQYLMNNLTKFHDLLRLKIYDHIYEGKIGGEYGAKEKGKNVIKEEEKSEEKNEERIQEKNEEKSEEKNEEKNGEKQVESSFSTAKKEKCIKVPLNLNENLEYSHEKHLEYNQRLFLRFCTLNEVSTLKSLFNAQYLDSSLKPLTSINFSYLSQWPLSTAIQSCQMDVFDYLMTLKPDIKATNQLNQNILHLACHNNFIHILEHKIIPIKDLAFQKDLQHKYPIDYCIENGFIQFTTRLSTNFMSPMSHMKMNYSHEIMKVLSESSGMYERLFSETMLWKRKDEMMNLLPFVNINKPFLFQYTPLQFAIITGWNEVISILLESKADPMIKSSISLDTSLHLAAMKQDLNVLADLIIMGKCHYDSSGILNADNLSFKSILERNFSSLSQFFFDQNPVQQIFLHYRNIHNPIHVFQYPRSNSLKVDANHKFQQKLIFPHVSQITLSLQLSYYGSTDGISVEITAMGPLKRTLKTFCVSFDSNGEAIVDISSLLAQSSYAYYSFTLRNKCEIQFFSVQATKIEKKFKPSIRSEILIGFPPHYSIPESFVLVDDLVLNNEEYVGLILHSFIPSLFNPQVEIIVEELDDQMQVIKEHIAFKATRIKRTAKLCKERMKWVIAPDLSSISKKPKILTFDASSKDAVVDSVNKNSCIFDISSPQIWLRPHSRIRIRSSRTCVIRNMIIRIQPAAQYKKNNFY